MDYEQNEKKIQTIILPTAANDMIYELETVEAALMDALKAVATARGIFTGSFVLKNNIL